MEEHWKYVGLLFHNNFVRFEKYPIFAKNKRQIISQKFLELTASYLCFSAWSMNQYMFML